MHPTDNRWIVLVLKPAGLAADDGKTRVTQLRELIGSRPAIKPHVEIDPRGLEARRIRRILEPDRDGKVVLVGGRSVFPPCVGRDIGTGFGCVKRKTANRKRDRE